MIALPILFETLHIVVYYAKYRNMLVRIGHCKLFQKPQGRKNQSKIKTYVPLWDGEHTLSFVYYNSFANLVGQ